MGQGYRVDSIPAVVRIVANLDSVDFPALTGVQQLIVKSDPVTNVNCTNAKADWARANVSDPSRAPYSGCQEPHDPLCSKPKEFVCERIKTDEEIRQESTGRAGDAKNTSPRTSQCGSFLLHITCVTVAFIFL